MQDPIEWILRHQLLDGSWGARPGDCECFGKVVARDVPRSARVERQARPLIEELGSSDLQKREQATDALRGLGDAAEAYLLDVENDGDGEVRLRVAALLGEIRARHVKGETGATA